MLKESIETACLEYCFHDTTCHLKADIFLLFSGLMTWHVSCWLFTMRKWLDARTFRVSSKATSWALFSQAWRTCPLHLLRKHLYLLTWICPRY